MNDIEVLEELIDSYDLYKEYRTPYVDKVLKAIENLLKERQSDKERIKDLEEINEAHKKREWRIKRKSKQTSFIKRNDNSITEGRIEQ